MSQFKHNKKLVIPKFPDLCTDIKVNRIINNYIMIWSKTWRNPYRPAKLLHFIYKNLVTVWPDVNLTRASDSYITNICFLSSYNAIFLRAFCLKIWFVFFGIRSEMAWNPSFNLGRATKLDGSSYHIHFVSRRSVHLFLVKTKDFTI